jgi:hypothetical protein
MAGQGGLASMFLQPQHQNVSLVTPEYPQRKTFYTLSAGEAAASSRLRVPQEILATAKSTMSPEQQPALVPRPGKTIENSWSAHL